LNGIARDAGDAPVYDTLVYARDTLRLLIERLRHRPALCRNQNQSFPSRAAILGVVVRALLQLGPSTRLLLNSGTRFPRRSSAPPILARRHR